jgi:hypothetical protein
MYAGNNPIRNLDPTGLDWFSYEEEYEDENGEKQKRTQYIFREEKMTKKEMQEGGYTHLGLVSFSDSEYLSLHGERVDKHNVSSVISLMETDFGQMDRNDLYANIDNAANYLSGIQWDESLPTSVDLQVQTYVVPSDGNRFVDLTNKNLYNKYDEAFAAQHPYTSRYNPLNTTISAEGRWIIGFLAAPIWAPMPTMNESIHIGRRQDREYQMYHYKKTGVIR